MMRKKALEDKKCKLDEQVAIMLAAKKARLQKEAPPAPSESKIDMGIFSGERGNLLEEIFAVFAPTAKAFIVGPRKVDISKITPPASPPSRTIDLSPPRDDSSKKKKKKDGVTAKLVGEGGGDVAGGDDADRGAGGVGGVGKGKGVDTEVDSSETAPHQTIYTKRPPGGGGATSGVVRSPQFENSHADSWDTHPACDDLPHAPRWNLTQGSRMNDLGNYR
ncbi:hypothetical protein Hdeb2414_s0017g00510421 [Helianthus debilis subsp. tardiflorus]